MSKAAMSPAMWAEYERFDEQLKAYRAGRSNYPSTAGIVRQMRCEETRMAKHWTVPVLFKGRQIDGIIVIAQSATKARQFARSEYNDRGYYRIAGYTLGKPVADDAPLPSVEVVAVRAPTVLPHGDEK